MDKSVLSANTFYHHGSKKQIPTTEPILPPPEEVLYDPDFKKTSKTIVKQLVNVRTILEVTE